MATLVPSFVAKVSRAKKHIVDLEHAITEYVGTDPYTVSEGVEGNGKNRRKVRRLTFTSDPANTDMPILVADSVYNLRSALDHLQNAIVPKKRVGRVYFPIYFDGVWNPVPPEENAERLKQRGRWLSDVKDLHVDAVAVLKALQPADGTLPANEVNLLSLVNRLSNTDRHKKIPVVAAGLESFLIVWEMPDGSTGAGRGAAQDGYFIENEAEIGGVPQDAVNVQIKGSPVIVTRAGDKNWHARIPRDLNLAVDLIEKRIIPNLSRFVRTPDG